MYQVRVAAAKRAGTAAAGRGVAVGSSVAEDGVGAVAEGMQEATSNAKVNTRARYLKVI